MIDRHEVFACPGLPIDGPDSDLALLTNSVFNLNGKHTLALHNVVVHASETKVDVSGLLLQIIGVKHFILMAC
jgi:hypothetical protein